MSNVNKIIEKSAMRWKEEMPSVLTSCGEAFNYSIDKTGDVVWAGVFEKDDPNRAARFKVCENEEEAREFCKRIEAAGKLPLCMGRNASSEDAGADMTAEGIEAPSEYEKSINDASGSGIEPKSAQFDGIDEHGAAEAVVGWLYNSDWLRGYSHDEALNEGYEVYWKLVHSALGELEYVVIDILENRLNIKEGKVAQVDLKELSEMELKKRAIRDNMKAENDAIMMYSSYIDLLPEGDAVRVGLEDIRNEEKEHAGELHKLLVDLDPEEESAFNEGVKEVEEEGTEKEAEAGKSRGKSDHMKAVAKMEMRRKATKKVSSDYNYAQASKGINVHMRSDFELDGEMTFKIAQMVSSKEFPFEDFSIWDICTVSFDRDYDGGKQVDVSVKSMRTAGRRESSVKAAGAGLAPQTTHYDDTVPFYAYYEGQTKDGDATIGVIQQQIGSQPQLTVVSSEGEIHDFGLFPNMEYAMRKAESFESMTYTEVASVAPRKTVRVTTASKEAQSFNYYSLLSRLMSDNEYFLGNGGRAEKHLWAGNVPDQIAKMHELWDALDEKPEWLTLEQIDDYERRMMMGMKTAQGSNWEEASDQFWYKYVGTEGSTINVYWSGWSNLPGNIYYDARGCYAYYDGVIDGRYEPSMEVARVKTISIDGLSLDEINTTPYAELLAKYNNPRDGFCMIEPAVRYCAELADEWLGQNMQRLATKTASGDWDEGSGVWGKVKDGYSLEVDYDHITPGKYHWEVIDLSQGGVSGVKVEEGDEDTLEGAQSAATQKADSMSKESSSELPA